MNESKIEWTTKTWNPVTGCDKVSAGCKNCYAARLATTRLKHLPYYKKGFYGNVVCHPERLQDPQKIKKPSMIFVNSMSDLFHPSVPFEFIYKVFASMDDAPQHTYQILTKRPERLLEFCKYVKQLETTFTIDKSIFIGVSIENHHEAWRLAYLRKVPALSKFISFEPLLCDIGYLNFDGIDWVIVGGETGPNYRKMDADWARYIKHECQVQNVPFFMKQMSGRTKIPADLKLREYPEGML